MVGHDGGKTFDIIINALKENGYYTKNSVLNSSEYGNIPQNRERIYIVGFRDPIKAFLFNFPQPIKLTRPLDDFIDFENKIENKYYYTEESFSYYDILQEEITRSDTVYQWRRKYVRENKSGLVPTLTANMGTGGHNVPLVKVKHGIRKLTPRETFNLQGFPSSFKMPDQADSHLYKQAGNSVVVPVIKRIAKQIYLTMNIDLENKSISQVHEEISNYKIV